MNPFEGMPRKRLPSMHLITELEGDVSLRDALAGYLFVMLHDRVQHNCLLKSVMEHNAKLREENKPTTPDGAVLGFVFGAMADLGNAGEEWSYLGEGDACVFYILADACIEQTQRWIAAGKEPPYEIPLGPLVERPGWTHFHNWTDPKCVEAVRRLSAEIVK